MKLKTIAFFAGILMLGACGNEKQNPELLKGTDFSAIQNGVRITLSFDAEQPRVHGKIVNRYNGAYEAEKDKIKFGPLMTTMMFGAEKDMSIEHDYFKFMEKVESYELKDNKLRLKNSDGAEMIFDKSDSTSE
ncbi:MAG: META domain-containing protein [Rickettsiales bacterium]|jgi:heat shock protein HslJ|nr:META domain-containing protein [Rickettsiales bacterium]